MMRLLIRRGLLSLDWKSIGITDVYSVANGVEAKELLLSTSIDLVIFDIRMPGFSGLELAQMVKERSMDVAVVLFIWIFRIRICKIGNAIWCI
ncbi:MAG: response regulator [Anaerobutyricum sp.]